MKIKERRVLLYSTYLGGPGSDSASGIAVDAAGNAYVAGETTSRDFPVVPGSFETHRSSSGSEAFVVKLNTGGSDLVYGTFLGGGAVDMKASAVAVDPMGSAYVTGSQPGPSVRRTRDALTDAGSGFLRGLDAPG